MEANTDILPQAENSPDIVPSSEVGDEYDQQLFEDIPCRLGKKDVV